MASTPVSTKPARRTQAERSATTQTALLDATIECVVEYGYVNTTTSRVAERAGVSRGAQVHHFPTKADLVSEAVAHLARRRIDMIREGMEALPEGRDRVAAAIDLLWEAHKGPAFDASLELWVAARTDPEMRSRVLDYERAVAYASWELAAEQIGPIAHDPDFHYAIDAALATMRGYALLRGSRGEDSDAVERRWAAVRPRLLALFPKA
jgi:AcrR family transcriptional regulator